MGTMVQMRMEASINGVEIILSKVILAHLLELSDIILNDDISLKMFGLRADWMCWKFLISFNWSTMGVTEK